MHIDLLKKSFLKKKLNLSQNIFFVSENIFFIKSKSNHRVPGTLYKCYRIENKGQAQSTKKLERRKTSSLKK